MKIQKFNYFDAFVEFTNKACEASVLLNDAIVSFDEKKVAERLDAIHKIEHEADDIKHTVIERLSREFVAPIEREDIIALVQEFDNVVDGIDDVMRKMSMYKIMRVRDDVESFTGLLVTGCEQLRELTKEFESFRKSDSLKNLLIEVHTTEAKADTLHFNATSRLFSSSENPVAIIAWQNIYDTLEVCFDNCEHAAEVMESVVLKNS